MGTMRKYFCLAAAGALMSANAFALTLTSSAFANDGVIPNEFAYSLSGQCSGSNWSPPLTIGSPPVGTASYAIVMRDLDAGNFLHWKAWNIPASTTQLAVNSSANENAATSGTYQQASNEFSNIGYSGPCPPDGSHRYQFTLYALNRTFSSEPSDAAIAIAALQTATLTGTRAPSTNLTWIVPKAGWWWNPSEGGRGFTIEQQGNNIFMAGYLYDPSGRATWYAAGPAAMNGPTFSAPLLTYLGGQTLTGTYRSPTGTIDNGTISITFTDATRGTITWPGGTVPIQRYDIVTNGSTATVPNGTPEAGWWWNSAEGGRGYSIEIQNGTMFLAGYMYDNSGNPIWYASGPTAMTNATTYQGTWQQYGNGQTLTGSFKPASVVNGSVGSITVNFSSTTNGTLTLPDGRQVSITRYRF